MSGGYDHRVLMQRTETERERAGFDRQRGRQTPERLEKWYVSFADVYSNSSLQFDIHQTLVFCFFTSFWLLYDLLKRTSYVSQGPAI